MGLIEKTAGTGVTVIGLGPTGGIGFANPGGSFNVQSGTLSLHNGGGAIPYTAGAITVATGATFDINNGGNDIYASGVFASTGGGQVTFTSGTLVGPSAWGGRNGVPPTTPATLDFAPNTFSDVGGVFADDQTLINTGAVTFTGANTLNGLLNQGTILFPDAGPLNFGGSFINDTAGLINFETNTAINILGNNAFQNNGTIIKSGGAGTLDLSGIGLTNAGTIEAASGTINLPDSGTLFGFNTAANVIVAGATYQVDAGAAITVQGSPAFTGNDGTVILNGAGASFPALATLNENDDTLSVLGGAAFTTAAALINTGTLNVGGDLTVTGTFTETQTTASGTTTTIPPAINFIVNGTPLRSGLFSAFWAPARWTAYLARLFPPVSLPPPAPRTRSPPLPGRSQAVSDQRPSDPPSPQPSMPLDCFDRKRNHTSSDCQNRRIGPDVRRERTGVSRYRLYQHRRPGCAGRRQSRHRRDHGRRRRRVLRYRPLQRRW